MNNALCKRPHFSCKYKDSDILVKLLFLLAISEYFFLIFKKSFSSISNSPKIDKNGIPIYFVKSSKSGITFYDSLTASQATFIAGNESINTPSKSKKTPFILLNFNFEFFQLLLQDLEEYLQICFCNLINMIL